LSGKLRNFKIEVGNSTSGPLGMVMRVNARTPAEAIEKANSAFAEFNEYIGVNPLADGIEYCNVYFGTLNASHIKGIETEHIL